MMMNREMARNFSSQVRRSLEMVQALRECKPCPYFARQLIQHNKKDGKSIYSYLHECDSNGATGLKFLPRGLFNF